jgi:NAD+ kinase
MAIIEQIIQKIKEHNGTVTLHLPIAEKITEMGMGKNWNHVFSDGNELAQTADVLFSVGGDGTFLGTVPYVAESQIPVLGFNSGRLGFLANVAEENISSAIDAWFNEEYSILERTLVEVHSSQFSANDKCRFALNDVTFRRTDSASMLSFSVEIDGHFLNTYWADGLIVSTATGSTAYSLSCGGPILAPDASALIITPIASHNLTVRPLVISNQSTVKISVSGRSSHYSLSVDSASYIIQNNEPTTLYKAKQVIKSVMLNNHSFYDTIREKLSWGMDKRN